ncbi:MAG TPA: response regulator [Candidatus Lumbricidophila sp.]|nr:response regulator [Candidatus Lumbricidophila sp.]
MVTGEVQRSVAVLIVDDDPLVRAAVTGILQSDAAIEVVGAAASGTEAVEWARRSRPDVVLMDIQMPGMDGIDTTSALLALIDTQVVAMTSITSHETV